MKRLIRNILLACIPLLLGAGISIALSVGLRPMPRLMFETDIGSTLFFMGAITSAILLAGVVGWELSARRGARWMVEARHDQEEARRRFIRRLDHELKNPLTGLRAALANLGALDGVPQTDLGRSLDQTAPSVSSRGRAPDHPGRQQDMQLSADAAQSMRDAVRQTERLSRLVADLRKLAELEERPLEMAPVDLAEVLEEVVAAVGGLPKYARRAISLVIPRVPWPLPPVTGDRDLLGLAFYNLVENALKYSGPADVVEVRAAEDGRWVSVEVADSGPGIAAEDLPRVFEELYRGANARGMEGSGLGLSLVWRVIDRHGGEISVRSSQNGQRGTVFRVRLRRMAVERERQS
jgi:two-component system, OmpR family, sensor kinase